MIEKAPFSSHAMLFETNFSDTSCLLDVAWTWSLIFGAETSGCLANKEVGELQQLFGEAVDRLQVHIGLGNQLWKGYYNKLILMRDLTTPWAYREDGKDARLHKHHQSIFLIVHHRLPQSTVAIRGIGCAQI